MRGFPDHCTVRRPLTQGMFWLLFREAKRFFLSFQEVGMIGWTEYFFAVTSGCVCQITLERRLIVYSADIEFPQVNCWKKSAHLSGGRG